MTFELARRRFGHHGEAGGAGATWGEGANDHSGKGGLTPAARPAPSAKEGQRSPCSDLQCAYQCTQRSILACFALGCRYCPIVTTSTPCSRRSRSVSTTSSFVSPRPTMIPDFVSTG